MCVYDWEEGGGLGVKGKGLEEERGDRRGGRGRRGRGRGDKKKRRSKN